MEPLLWLLLPVAAASGWISARVSARRQSVVKESAPQISQHCIQGLNYLLSEQSDKAIQLLVEMVDVDEDTVETHLILGSLFRRRGEVSRAIRIHQNIIARPSLSPRQKSDALLQLGVDYLKAGLLDRAENIFLQLIEGGTKRREVFRNIRNLYEQEKEWEKAIESALKLEACGGHSQQKRVAHYHCELVERHIRKQRVAQAQGEVQKAMATDPDCVRACIQSGDIHASLGQRQEAIAGFRDALEKDPYFSPLIFKRLYSLFSAQGQLIKFPEFIRKYADCEQDSAARFFLIKSHERLGDHGKVNELLHDELNRKEVSPYIVRSYLELMRDNTEGEIRDSFIALTRVLETRLSAYMACHCTRCGFESNAIFWQCPGCQSWGTVRPYQNPVEYSWLDT